MKRGERLEFSRLEPYLGVFVQAVGDHTEAGQTQTVVVALGPEFGSDSWLEFDSMINVRPAQGNRSRSVEDPALRALIVRIVDTLVQP